MIVHIMIIEKFIPPFIEFVNKNFNSKEHIFILLGKKENRYGMKEYQNAVWIDKKYKVFSLLRHLYKAEKIIIHGLWSENFLKVLYLTPCLLKKSYWVMWGGDFYFPDKQSNIKKQVIKKIGHFVTYIKGDYELVKKWYGANGEYHECIMYPSNLFKEYNVDNIPQKDYIAIQIGNSATETNNHFEVFEKLKKYRNENIMLYVPLSYGDKEYAKKVIKKGYEIFGEKKFKPILEFMPFDKYLEFLAKIDIAIFNHNRQQGMGNIITLLGLGKKVYMRSDVTSWKMFEEKGIKIFDFENIEISLIDERIKKENIEKIKTYFSEENLKSQLEKIFESQHEKVAN